MSRIGLAIALGNHATQHTKTFIEAVNYSLSHFPAFKKNALRIVNDFKSHDGGYAAARELVDWGADVVVGHFSSFSALSALPVYADKKVPVVLPASTSCDLQSEAKRLSCCMFRYQRDNASLMRFCVDDCVISLGQGNGYAIVQDNLYANTLMEYMPLLSQITVLRGVPGRIDRNGTYIVIGYSDFAAQVIKQLTQSQVHRVVVMDDSDSEESYGACIIRPDRLSRVRSVSHIARHGQKRAFWDETLLGLSLAVKLAESAEPDGTNAFSTYLGQQHFGRDGCYEDTILVSEDIS